MNSIATFVESKDSTSILEGAIASVEAVFQTSAPLVVKRALFDKACWLVSERHGKYKTRYRTSDSSSAPTELLRHDHVIPRAHLWIVARTTMTVSEALRLCEGCLVTEEEHKRLHDIDDAYGWERYVKAGIQVIDTSTGKIVPADLLLDLSKGFKQAYRDSRFVSDGEEELAKMQE